MMLFRPLLLLGAMVFAGAAAQVSNDDPTGKVLYVNYPSCDSYKCKVVWRQGERRYVNWLAPPKGNLKIQLTPQEGTTGLPTYTLTKSISGAHHSDACDNMGQTNAKCGRFFWNVPKNAVVGEYQIEVTSLSNPSIVGYTDTVSIKPAKSNKAKRHTLERTDGESTEDELEAIRLAELDEFNFDDE